MYMYMYVTDHGLVVSGQLDTAPFHCSLHFLVVSVFQLRVGGVQQCSEQKGAHM